MFAKISQIMRDLSNSIKKEETEAEAAAENETMAESWMMDPETSQGGIADVGTGSLDHGLAQLGQNLSGLTKQLQENMSDVSIEQFDQNIDKVGARAMSDGAGIHIDENFDPSVNTAEASMIQSEQVHMMQDMSDMPQISVEEALAALEHARGQDGIDPDLQDILNHPDAQAMLENLKENGINSFDMHGTDLDGLSPDEQILEILESGRKATIEHGLEMPQSEQDVSQEVSLTELEYEHDHANDDYGVA